MNWFWLVIGGLAAYRLSLLISKEDGPAYIFRKLRRLPPPKSSTKEGLACQWCMSIWSSAAVTGYLCWMGAVGGREWVLYWLAISSLAVICNQQWTKG